LGLKGRKTDRGEKIHNVELHSLYSSPSIVRVIKSRRMRWAGHVSRMGEGRGVYGVLVGKPEGNRPLGKPRRRWENYIKLDLTEILIDGTNWIRLAQDRDHGEHGDEPSGSIKDAEFFDYLSDCQFLKKDSATWS